MHGYRVCPIARGRVHILRCSHKGISGKHFWSGPLQHLTEDALSQEMAAALNAAGLKTVPIESALYAPEPPEKIH